MVGKRVSKRKRLRSTIYGGGWEEEKKEEVAEVDLLK